MEKEKIKFPFKCPVCDKEEFDDLDWFINESKDDEVETYRIDPTNGEKVRITDPIEIYNVHCSHCGWVYDLKQVLDYNVIGDRNKKAVNVLKQEYQNKLKENPKYNYDEETSKPMPHNCPICGKHQFKYVTSYEVCPICGWQDDGTDADPFDDYSEVNAISIHEAKQVFMKKRKHNPKYRCDKEKNK